MTGDIQYIRAAEIAELTGVSLRTVRRWIKDEVLPSTKLGGARLVAMADLKAVLSASHDAVKQGSGEGEETDHESAA
jgi:excisionase family DNA binding protein